MLSACHRFWGNRFPILGLTPGRLVREIATISIMTKKLYLFAIFTSLWICCGGVLGQDFPDLRAALAVAMVEHPTLRAREADVRATESDIEGARWQFWPTPSVNVARPNRALIAGTDRAVTSVSLRQPLWTGGRLTAALAYATARNQTAEAVRAEARRDIALEVIQAWGELWMSAERVRVYEGSATTHRQFLQQIQRRTASGLSVQSDIALANSRLEAVQADLATARAALAAARERLRTLTGRSTTGAGLPTPLWPRHAAEDALQNALRVDPGLQRLNAEVQELMAQIDTTRSSYWPELYASVSQRHGDVTGQTSQVAVGFESRWGAGLSNMTALQAAYRRLQAKQEDLAFRSRKLSEQVRSEQHQLEAIRSREAAFRQALDAATAVAQSWDRQFVLGKKAWQDLMNAVRESTQTEIQLVDATGTAAIVDWRLAVFTQGIDWVLQPTAAQP